MLMETGRIEKREGQWVAAAAVDVIEIPPTLQGLITARLDRVSHDLKRLLQRGSLAGRLFSTAALAALGDGSPPDPASLREAVRRDLLVEVEERALGSGQVFRFKHVLIRDVTYSTVPKAERSRLHDRYGRWLEKSLGDRSTEVAEIIAHHAEQAYRFARDLSMPAAQPLGRRALDLLFAAAWNALDRDDAAALNLSSVRTPSRRRSARRTPSWPRPRGTSSCCGVRSRPSSGHSPSLMMRSRWRGRPAPVVCSWICYSHALWRRIGSA